MGVDVVLVQVRNPGTSPKRRVLTTLDMALDKYDAFANLCTASDLSMPNRVDPYRSLILTPGDMDQFVSELDRATAYPIPPGRW